MKTPDDLKKGLELHRGTLQCDGICPYDGWNAETGSCIQRLMKDTVEYIQQLESRLAQAERERDAAIRDCSMPPCATCLYKGKPAVCYICHGLKGGGRVNYEWRGVCEENTKECEDEKS